MIEICKRFTELNKNDVHRVGGKGASLGEMTNAGIPVPPGFVLTAQAFDQFVKETELSVEIEAALDAVNYHDVNSVDNASRKIQDMIHDAHYPQDIQDEVLKYFAELNVPFVAVRSSATAEDSSTASWAGELDSYLNTDADHVLGNVKRCWASLFTPRAIVYRTEKGMRATKVSVAVVVQAMVQSEVSGITFTVHPVTQDYNQMIIEAGWGLGEAIVSGSVTPDSYVLHKDDFKIIETYVADQERMIIKKETGDNHWVEVASDMREKQKLSNEQVIELAKICKNIEKHYGFPCDIEWGMVGGVFYIVQSRPITTL